VPTNGFSSGFIIEQEAEAEAAEQAEQAQALLEAFYVPADEIPEGMSEWYSTPDPRTGRKVFKRDW